MSVERGQPVEAIWPRSRLSWPETDSSVLIDPAGLVGAPTPATGLLAELTGLLGSGGHAGVARSRLEDLLAGVGVLLDQFPDGVAIVESASNRLCYVNTAYARMHGYTPAELVGADARTLYPPEVAERELPRVRRLVDSGQTLSVELAHRRADGSVFVGAMRISPLRAGPARAVGRLATLRDTTWRRAREDAWAQAARTDALTGVLSRQAVLTGLDRALDARAADGLVGVCYLDADGFKAINDTLGHAAGDRVLAHLGVRLAATVREGDLVGRLGGDEFLVVATGLARPEAAQALAERITADLAGHPVHLHGHTFSLGASIGVAMGQPGQHSVDELLDAADRAMYQAKHGVCAIHLADRPGPASGPEPSTGPDPLSLATDLRLALGPEASAGADGLWVAYQPVVDTGLPGTGRPRLLGVEALVRWAHPRYGALSPDQFLPAAAAARLISLLDAWVLDQALDAQEFWTRPSGGLLPVAVNLSGTNAADPRAADRILAALAAHRATPDRLTVELTETALTPLRLPGIGVTLRRLHEAGVRISLDDFGTGTSSLVHLRTLAVDEVKIDASITGDLANPAAAGIVTALLAFAAITGKTIVAEGVQTRTQARRLAELGATHQQGYHHHRPQPADQIARLLRPAGPFDVDGLPALQDPDQGAVPLRAFRAEPGVRDPGAR